jgi:hypothetical protein
MSKELLANMSWEDKEFFVDPPSSDASVEQWEQWLSKDKAARAASKSAYTKKINAIADENGISIDDYLQELPPEGMNKIGGVYRQGSLVGFTGDFEEGTGSIEVAIDPQQEKFVVWNRMAADRAKGSKGDIKTKQARRRANKSKKRAKKARWNK